jgi:hypothetical protein
MNQDLSALRKLCTIIPIPQAPKYSTQKIDEDSIPVSETERMMTNDSLENEFNNNNDQTMQIQE